MKKETKEALYSLLDLMDMLGSIEFINIDIDKTNKIRKEVLDVIGEKEKSAILDSNTEELLGILPMILLEFPSAREVIHFAEICLNIKPKDYWFKKSKQEVAGIVLNEVYKQSPKQLNKFLKAWNKFNSESVSSNLDKHKSTDNNGFMDAWFKFFDNYKGIDG